MLKCYIFTTLLFLSSGCGSSNGPAPEEIDLQLILSQRAVSPEGNFTSLDAVRGKYIGLYFSASWCPPCRAFTPKLIHFRNELASQFEVVLIGSDRSVREQQAYVAESGMPWPALPNQSRPAYKLKELFEVRSIPTLIVLSPEGRVLSIQGRDDVSRHGLAALDTWIAKNNKL